MQDTLEFAVFDFEFGRSALGYDLSVFCISECIGIFSAFLRGETCLPYAFASAVTGAIEARKGKLLSGRCCQEHVKGRLFLEIRILPVSCKADFENCRFVLLYLCVLLSDVFDLGK